MKRPKTKTAYWSKIRKKAPKVPDITCPAIDSVLNKLEKQVDRALTIKQFKMIERKLEKLRTANEKLRESGVYWHDACKDTVRDLLGKRKICTLGNPCTLFEEDPIKFYATEDQCIIKAEQKSRAMVETFQDFGYYIDSEAHSCMYVAQVNEV